jgi:TorA maturation chaperone TorD
MSSVKNSVKISAPSARRREEAQNLLAEAALFRLVALGFAAPRLGRFEELRKAFMAVDAKKNPLCDVNHVASALREARLAWFSASPSDVSAEYLRLFMGASVVSLYETAYGDGRRIGGRPVELADIGGFYSAFGFALNESDPVLADHLCAECEFMSLLSIKESYALVNGWTMRWASARAAADAFLEQHLGRWPETLLNSLCGESAPYAFVALVKLLNALIWARCRARGLRPLATKLLLEKEMDEEELACPQAVGRSTEGWRQ